MACIQIEREGDRFEVEVDNPEIVKQNQAPGKNIWKDPSESYTFDTWDEVKAFLDKIVDKALPPDEYSAAFAKAAKEAMSDE